MYKKYFRPLEGKFGINMGPVLILPKSRGSVTLRSAKPFDHPNIDPNYFSEKEDVEQFVRGNKKTNDEPNPSKN